MSGDVKAGRYELVAELWDEYLSEPGKPFDFKRHRKGDLVDLDVEQARRLVAAGAVVEPGAIEAAQAEALRLQYEAALAALPPKPKAVDDDEDEDLNADGQGEPGTPASAATANPLDGMKLADLRDYAAAKGISLDGVDSRKVDGIRAAIAKAEQS